PFSGKYGILGLKDLGVMGLDHAIVDGVQYSDIVRGGCKFRLLVKINAIPINDPIVVIYPGVLYSVTTFYIGVITSAFTIYFIGFPRNGRGTVQIGIFSGSIIVQLF